MTKKSIYIVVYEVRNTDAKSKCGYLYKFNADRMAHTSIMLPVTNIGTPDYDFMEQFGRMMMLHKYNQYLAFLETSDTKKE